MHSLIYSLYMHGIIILDHKSKALVKIYIKKIINLNNINPLHKTTSTQKNIIYHFLLKYLYNFLYEIYILI